MIVNDDRSNHYLDRFNRSFPLFSMSGYLESYSFGPSGIVLACTFLFALLVLPETQGTTPEELIAEMTRRNSRSMVYEVNEEDVGAIDLEWRKAMEQLMEEEQTQMQAGTYGTYIVIIVAFCGTESIVCLTYVFGVCTIRLWIQANRFK